MALLSVQCARAPIPLVAASSQPAGVSALPPDGPRAPSRLQLCSWNLKKLGHGEAKDFGIIRQVIDEHCDLVAVVEVMQKAGEHPGYAQLMAALGAGWSGTITDSPRPNTGAGHAEFYAAVWRPEKVNWCDGWGGLRYFMDNDGSKDGLGRDRFSREPAYGCFQAVAAAGLGFDFLLGIYHATWEKGDSTKIAAEVRHLGSVVDEMRRARPGEKDVFVVGDFNLVPAQLAAATSLTAWIDGEGSTLNARGERTTHLYDHVLVAQPSASLELRRKARVLDVRDMHVSTRAFARTVSDHLPVALEIDIFRADHD